MLPFDKKYLLLIVAVVTLNLFFAQDSDFESSYSNIELMSPSIKDSAKKQKKYKFLFAFDARRSFVMDRNVKFNGIKIGLTYLDKARFGLGFYGMRNPIRMQGIQLDPMEYPNASDTIYFNFTYSGLFYEPIWYNSKRWQLSTPVNFGGGEITLSYKVKDSTRTEQFMKGGVPVFGVRGAAQFKVFRWLAVGTGLGYRFILVEDKQVKSSISAPFYNFSVKVLFGELFRMAFKKEELEEW